MWSPHQVVMWSPNHLNHRHVARFLFGCVSPSPATCGRLGTAVAYLLGTYAVWPAMRPFVQRPRPALRPLGPRREGVKVEGNTKALHQRHRAQKLISSGWSPSGDEWGVSSSKKKHLEFMNPGRSPNGDGLGGGIETGPGRSTAPSSSPFGSFTTSPSASTRCSAAPPAPRMESPHGAAWICCAPQTIPALRYFGFRRFWVFFVLGARRNLCRRWCREMSPVLVPRCFNPQAQNPDISFLKVSPLAIPKDLYSHSYLSGFPSASAGFMYSRGQLDILSKGFEPMLCAQGWSAAHCGFLPIW